MAIDYVTIPSAGSADDESAPLGASSKVREARVWISGNPVLRRLAYTMVLRLGIGTNVSVVWS